MINVGPPKKLLIKDIIKDILRRRRDREASLSELYTEIREKYGRKVSYQAVAKAAKKLADSGELLERKSGGRLYYTLPYIPLDEFIRVKRR